MRASVLATCSASANFGLSASSRPAAVTPPTANLAAPSRKPRRSIPPCTYLSNRRRTSGSKSAAVLRGRGASVMTCLEELFFRQPTAAVRPRSCLIGPPRDDCRRRPLKRGTPMTHATDLADCSAIELLQLYGSGQASPVEATRAVIARIDRLDPTLNAFCFLAAEDAFRSARESEARWTRGEPCGDLDGVPLSIKDLILAKGWPTRRGSRTVDPNQAWDC